jgi:hypothetical protein
MSNASNFGMKSHHILSHSVADMTDLKTFLKPGKFYSLAQDEIVEIKQAQKARAKWMLTRRKVVDEFARERTGDPSQTNQSWKIGKKMKRTRENNWNK